MRLYTGQCDESSEAPAVIAGLFDGGFVVGWASLSTLERVWVDILDAAEPIWRVAES